MGQLSHHTPGSQTQTRIPTSIPLPSSQPHLLLSRFPS
nr:MAG TPA: hypothetical protein [Caudoviricetes sp.]